MIMKMKYTIPVTEDMACARSTIRASVKDSITICKELNRMKFAEAKDFTTKLINKEVTVGTGKHHTGAAEKILVILNSLEANAINKGLEPEKMQLFMSAHQGPALMRARRKRMYGSAIRITHVHALLKKKVKKSERKAVDKRQDKTA